MYFGLIDVILVHSGQQHVPATLVGAENKNTNITKLCVNKLTVQKSRSFS
jgi:hypothetical protein